MRSGRSCAVADTVTFSPWLLRREGFFMPSLGNVKRESLGALSPFCRFPPLKASNGQNGINGPNVIAFNEYRITNNV